MRALHSLTAPAKPRPDYLRGDLRVDDGFIFVVVDVIWDVTAWVYLVRPA